MRDGKAFRTVRTKDGTVARTPHRDRTDLARVDATTDDEIERQVADDEDVAPIFTREMAERAQWVEPQRKTAISLRVDSDVLEWFRQQGRGYLTQMNRVLRAFAEHEQQRYERLRSGRDD